MYFVLLVFSSLLSIGLLIHGESCPDGWLQVFSHCYRVHTNESIVWEGVHKCSESYGHLANAEVNPVLKLVIYTFASASHQSLWMAYDNAACRYVENMEVKSGSCYDKRGYVCERTQPVDEQCGDYEFSRFVDKCYFLGTPSSRLVGKTFCENFGGILAPVSNVLQASHAKAMAVIQNITLWVGNTLQEDEQCMRISADGDFKLLTSDCDIAAIPLCEKSVASTISTTPSSSRSIGSLTTERQPTPESASKNENKIAVCPHYSWTSPENSSYCYLEASYLTERMNWDEARYYCKGYGGDLASYANEEEEAFALGGAKGHKGGLWIGLRHYPTVSVTAFVWSDGSPVNYTNWDENQPDITATNKNCVAQVGTESAWSLSYCGTMRWFICKAPKTLNPPSPRDLPEQNLCGENEHYELCATACPKTCDNYKDNNFGCIEVCKEGCFCNVGFVRAPNGKCVRPDQCAKTPKCADFHDISPWYLFRDHCYSVRITNDHSWFTAKDYCVDNIGNLTSIHSPEENEFILSIVRGNSDSNLWIGLSSHGLHSSFTWYDKSPINFINWDEDYDPYNVSLGLNKCVTFDKFTGFWRISHCNTFLSVLCKRNVGNTEVTPPVTSKPKILPGFCPDEWYTLGNYCYKSFGLKTTEKRSWTDASKKCQRIGSQLASIHSVEEQDFLSDLVMDVGHAVWIGLYAAERNSLYHWTDNSSLDYTSWNEFEPFSSGRPEDCVEMVFDEENMGKWNDVVCGKPKAFICKQNKDSSLKEPGLDPSKCSNPEGWSKLGHSCFSEIYENSVSWLEAQMRCKNLGANLPVVHSHGVTVFLKRTLSHFTDQLVWIGARGLGIQESIRYAWITQFPMGYSNWLDLQPQPVSEHDNCVAVNAAGKWIVRDCTENLPFLCEFSTRNSPNISSQSQSTCPNSSVEWIDLNIGTNCYHISTTKEMFIDAMRLCVFKGASLASFHSPEELDAIAPFLVALDWPVYIGLAEKFDGSFGWVDNSAVDYVHWEEGEPNSSEESCVEMDPKVLTWNDIKCEEKRYYMCSAPKVPNLDIAASVNNPTNNVNNLTNNEKIEARLAAGGIVSIVICVVVIMIFVAVFSYYLCPRSKNKIQGRSILTEEHNF